MNLQEHPTHKAIYDLCQEIEKLPASDQQTKVVTLAAKLQDDVVAMRSVADSNSRCLRRLAAECFPEVVDGQKHFARVLMEGVAYDLDVTFNPQKAVAP